MKNNPYQKSFKSKTAIRFLSLLLAGAMLLSLCACTGQKNAPETFTMNREPEPQALQTANQATALALRYYIYARLKTEELIEADFESMSNGAFENQMDELVLIWETADALTAAAESITDQAILLLETASVNQTAAIFQPQAQFATLSTEWEDFAVISLADTTGEVVDRQTWAENLSKQYDALRGAQRYKQLAQQLGVDTKTAVEQMALAQKIIRNAADLEEAQAEVGAYTRSINIVQGYKTASKVGLFIGATVATGGGSLASLAGSSMTMAQTGAVIVGGVDCIVDVGTTTSTIVLGEDHQVTTSFGNIQGKLAPLSALVGLATFNAGETGEQLAYIGDSLVDWYYNGKVLGINVTVEKDGSTKVSAQDINIDQKEAEEVQSALEKAGFISPERTGSTIGKLIEAYTLNGQTAKEAMQAIALQITESVEDDESQSPPPQDTDPSDEESDTLTGEQSQETATGSITTQEIAGTYSGSATLQYVADDVEADDSIGITLQLNESGTGTASVYGFSGDAQCAGSTVTFSVTMKEGGATVSCEFEGSVNKSDNGITISGVMSCSMMGTIFASYAWTAQK